MVVLLGLRSVLIVGAQADQQQPVEEALDDQSREEALAADHVLSMVQAAHTQLTQQHRHHTTQLRSCDVMQRY